MSHLFISHSTKDGAAPAAALTKALETAGHRGWIAPRDVKPGIDYPSQIVGAIEASAGLVLLVTAAANESRDVLQEVQVAHSAHKHIVPVIVQETAPSAGLRYFIGVRHQIAWSGAVGTAKALDAVFARSAPEQAVRPSHTVASSYRRDPSSLEDWPQAKSVEECVRVFLDRWGSSKPAASAFRKAETVPNSSELSFAFLLAVEPERRGKETTVLARVCFPNENADRPNRFLVTKYFDRMGERFRADVAKTPQYSRGVIQIRDVPPENGSDAVALDFEVPLVGDPREDIRLEDVTQYKTPLNILRMFA